MENERNDEMPRSKHSPKRRERSGHTNEDISNITREIDYLKEIQDIKDELKMIEKILAQQREVFGNPDFKRSRDVHEVRRSLLIQLRNIERLRVDASEVETSVSLLACVV
jgi:hypothetical protein